MATSNTEAANGVPTGTGPKNEAHVLQVLKALNARNIETIHDVVLSGVSGEPLDDKTYLMEHIIQLVADLPLHDRVSDTLTNNFLKELWYDLGHPPDSYLGYDFVFRKADGSNNNVLWPHIGKAGAPYARSVSARKMQPPPPDPGVIFDSVLARPKGTFDPHPHKISSVLFYIASIIIHDCFHTSHTDYAISETSSYLDLAPLYGSTLEQQMSIRTKKDGKLLPDCFADARIMGFPPGVGAILIMFNRFHNHVAENLKQIDENGRFSQILKGESRRRTGLTPKDKENERTPEQDYDEALFQTARLVTGGLYINIVLQDYVRTILGLNRVDSLWNLDPRAGTGKDFMKTKIPQAQGNQVSAEFSLVYRWHSCISQRDDVWSQGLMRGIMEDATSKAGGNPIDHIKVAAKWADDIAKTEPYKRKFMSHDFKDLQRDKETGRFSDDDLFKIWTDSVDDIAGSFGANHVPLCLKFVEVLSMKQARSWNLASLNEFREYFKLQPHKTFESINPDPKVYKALEKLYGHPDNVEIYPGIVVESAKKPMAPGSGLAASWTTSRAILADAVSLIRGDRFLTVDYTPKNLTNWGFHAASYDLNINHGGVFYKLVLNAFPNSLAKNSVYAHFPLVHPEENKVILKGMNRAQLYNFELPTARKAPVSAKASSQLGTKALADSSGFDSLWIPRSAMLDVPEAAKEKLDAKVSFAQAILDNKKWEPTTTKFYTTKLQELWQEKQYELGGSQQIDVVADVLNAAHAEFISSIIGIPKDGKAKQNESQGIIGFFGHIFELVFLPHASPKGLNAAVRDDTHKYAGAIESKMTGNTEATSKPGELGQEAFAKLTKAHGSKAKQVTWQDILPTSALLLTILCRASAAAVEKAVDKTDADTHAKSNAAASSLGSIGKRATTDVHKTEKNQIVCVHLPGAHSKDDFAKYGPEVELALRVAEIANAAIVDVIEKEKGVARAPGPQGIIKHVKQGDGDVRYLNDTECDYVAYPKSMKLRWKN